MTEEQKRAIKEYEECKIKTSELEFRMEQLKPIILEAVTDADKIELEHGFLYTQPRVVFRYSEAVDVVQKELDDLKKKEKADGTAEQEITRTIYYKQKRD